MNEEKNKSSIDWPFKWYFRKGSTGVLSMPYNMIDNEIL